MNNQDDPIVCPECLQHNIETVKECGENLYRCLNKKCKYEFDDYELDEGYVIEISDKGMKRIK